MSEGRAEDGRGPEPPRATNGAEEPGSERFAQPVAGDATATSGAGMQGGEGPRPAGDVVPSPVGGQEAPLAASAPPMIRTMGGRPLVDPAAVLLAVERVGADVAALGRALAAQPEEVAARLDVDSATASLGVRIGALGSALDQLRLSLLAGLDRAAEHASAPSWLPELQARLAELAPRLDEPPWLPSLQATLSQRDQTPLWLPALYGLLTERDETPPWLPALHVMLTERDLAPPWLDDLRARVAELDTRLATPPWLPALRDVISERTEAPPWLPALQAAVGSGAEGEPPAWLADLQTRLGALETSLDAPRWLRDLNTALAGLAPRLDAPPWLDDLQTSIRELSARVEAPSWLAGLHATLVDLKPLVAEQQRALRDAVTQLAVLELSLATAPGNEPVLNAIAKLASDDRMRELTVTVERVADDGRTLGDGLGRLEQAITDLADGVRAGAGTVERVADDGQNASERLGRVEQAIADLADGVRAGGAIADVLDHLGQRLVGIEDAAARVANDARTLVEQVVPIPDRLSAIASQVDRITPLARAGDQAGTLFDQLDGVAARLDEVVTLLRPATPDGDGDGEGQDEDQDLDERLEAVVDVLAGVTRRQDRVTEAADAVLASVAQQEQSMASHLDWVGERLAEVAAHLVPDAGRRDSDAAATGGFAEIAQALAAVARRQDELGAALAGLLERDRGNEWVAEQLAAVARRQDELGATLVGLLKGRSDAGPVADQVAELARRQEDLTAALASSFDEGRGPMAAAAVFDRMEQRERSLAARLDRIDAQLRRAWPGGSAGDGGEAGPIGDPDRDAAISLASSVEAIAKLTENLASLVESSSERLDRRLSRVEGALAEVQRVATPGAGPAPVGSPSADTAALRLAELRAQRAEVQARLQEERLLAARVWDDDR